MRRLPAAGTTPSPPPPQNLSKCSQLPRIGRPVAAGAGAQELLQLMPEGGLPEGGQRANVHRTSQHSRLKGPAPKHPGDQVG